MTARQKAVGFRVCQGESVSLAPVAQLPRAEHAPVAAVSIAHPAPELTRQRFHSQTKNAQLYQCC